VIYVTFALRITWTDMGRTVIGQRRHMYSVQAKDDFAARLAAVCILSRMESWAMVGLLDGPIKRWKYLENHWRAEGYDIIAD
jgi:hypothetical protein